MTLIAQRPSADHPAAPDGADRGRGLRPGSIVLVLGTRPEIIKLAGIARELGPAARTVYTGQHYDHQLGPAFFAELDMAPPDVVLAVGGSPRGRQVGDALSALDAHLAEHPAAAVVVQGDTNSALAGALAANGRDVPLVHVEAGLRSFDRAMPEEHNRVVVDHLADVLCAPTPISRAHLLAEGLPEHRVVVTGNTVVEALQRLVPAPGERRARLAALGLEPSGYALATFHRPENVDDAAVLEVVLTELAALPVPVVLPLHPRTAARVRSFGLGGLLERLRVVEPLPYASFLALSAEAALLVSDSGGVQEECSVLGRPLVVVRASTERPEVIGTFAELVPPGPRIGEVAGAWLADLPAVRTRLAALPSPYGDGSASRRCVDALTAHVTGHLTHHRGGVLAATGRA